MSPGQDSDNDKVRDMEIERPLSRNSIFGNSNIIQRARESIVDLGISLRNSGTATPKPPPEPIPIACEKTADSLSKSEYDGNSSDNQADP